MSRIMKWASAVGFFSGYIIGVNGHGRLTLPRPRIVTERGGSYENDPVSGPTGADFVCREERPANPKVIVPVRAGGVLDVSWGFSAAHVGDCALWLSYDVSLPRTQQRYFKIANFPECNVDNNKVVQVNLPAWLPGGNAILRWDWYALHQYPRLEWYAQCADVSVTAGAAPRAIGSIPKTLISTAYPTASSAFRNPFPPAAPVAVTGPACAEGITGNCCVISGYRAGAGYAACGRTGTSSGGGSGTPVGPSVPTPTNPVTSTPNRPAPNPNRPSGSCAKPYEQCGGNGWSGATCCESGYTCKATSTWYSNCHPSTPRSVGSEVEVSSHRDKRSVAVYSAAAGAAVAFVALALFAVVRKYTAKPSEQLLESQI